MSPEDGVLWHRPGRPGGTSSTKRSSTMTTQAEGGNDGRHFQRKEAFAHWRYRRPTRCIPSGPHRSHSRRHKQRLRRLAEYADSSGASRGGRAGGRDLHVAPKRLVLLDAHDIVEKLT